MDFPYCCISTEERKDLSGEAISPFPKPMLISSESLIVGLHPTDLDASS